jgi:hypothetical protein
MKHLQLYEGFLQVFKETKKEKKDLTWIYKSIGNPSSELYKTLDVQDGQIPIEKIDSKITELQDKRGKGEKLTKKESKLLRRLELAKTLKTRL